MVDKVEIRVWCENGDFLGLCDTVDEAMDVVEQLQRDCPCGTQELPECGVFEPHGYFFDIVDNGYVNRNDYLY